VAKQPKQFGCATGCLLIVVVFLAWLIGSHRQGEPNNLAVQTTPSDSLLPEIRTFLTEHAEFGGVRSTEPIPNWAKGSRQRVNFDSGRSLLFYMKNGKVITVYEHVPGEDRKVIWGDYDRE
jgi:hypothetical protein